MAKDGKEIIFTNSKTRQFSAIPVRAEGGGLRFGDSMDLFPIPDYINVVVGFNPLDVTRDGKFIVFPRALQKPEDSNMIHIKSGWIDEGR
jgi:hypothetical protein